MRILAAPAWELEMRTRSRGDLLGSSCATAGCVGLCLAVLKWMEIARRAACKPKGSCGWRRYLFAALESDADDAFICTALKNAMRITALPLWKFAKRCVYRRQLRANDD